MILFKIVQKFLLPSVFILIFMLAGLLIFKLKKQKAGKILLIVGIVFYYFLSITPVADLIIGPLENQYNHVQETDFGMADRVVLLTGSKVPRASEVLRLYFKKNKELEQKVEIIISGTNAINPEKNNEAVETKKHLTERGVPAENIIIEDKSRNTLENAQYVETLVGGEPFFLVTSAYHMPRSMEVFQKMGTNAIPAPTDFKTRRGYTLFDFFPNPGNLEKSNLAFHEYLGILYYRIKL